MRYSTTPCGGWIGRSVLTRVIFWVDNRCAERILVKGAAKPADANVLVSWFWQRCAFLRIRPEIYPAEVEAVLLSHPDVEDAAVVGVPSKEMGEEIIAFVTGAADAGTLDAYVRDRIASYKVPKAFVMLEALPKSGLGKVQKEALKKNAENFL